MGGGRIVLAVLQRISVINRNGEMGGQHCAPMSLSPLPRFHLTSSTSTLLVWDLYMEAYWLV